MPLTDSAIKTAKSKEKPYKLSDAGGTSAASPAVSSVICRTNASSTSI